MATLTTLPDEIILHILSALPANALVASSASNHKFHTLASDQTLWRRLCTQDFGAWDKRHNIPPFHKNSKYASAFDWKALYVTRCGIHRNTQRALDSIVAGQYGRVEKARSLVAYGVDIRDVLMRNVNPPADAEDWLARRWYARLLLGRLQREQAVLTWKAVADGEDVGLVEALHAFDIFVRREQAPSFAEVTAEIEKHARSCRESYPEWDELTSRDKAIAVARYLQTNDLVGLRHTRNYSDVRNSFIGCALFGPDHSSLQLISTAIFCGVAHALGLDAKPCGFPGHVLAIVYPKPGLTLDDTPLVTNMTLNDDSSNAASPYENRLYLDPYSSRLEKPHSELLASLAQIGIGGTDLDIAMGPASTLDIVRRCGRNIIGAIQRPPTGMQNNEEAGIDHQTALYGALWAFLLLIDPESTGESSVAQRQSYLPHFMQRFEHHFPFDVHLLVDMICPMYDAPEDRQVIRNHLRDTLGADTIPRPVKSRKELRDAKVKYRVGQIFTHVKYGYDGLIYGWDSRCVASDEWVTNMDVHSLERGSMQSFYHTFSADGSNRYVAEDNINIITPNEPPAALLREAGQWFKRWDPVACMFVNNMSEEYPDD